MTQVVPLRIVDVVAEMADPADSAVETEDSKVEFVRRSCYSFLRP